MSKTARIAPRIGIGLAVIGGAAVIGGCFLPWYSVRSGVTVGTRVFTGEPIGRDTMYGSVALIAGGLVVLTSLLAFIGRLRKVLAAVIIAAALGAGATTIVAISDPKKGYIDFVAEKAASRKSSAREIQFSLESLFKVSNLRAETGEGAWAVVGGAGLAALGGIAVVVGRRRRFVESTEITPETITL